VFSGSQQNVSGNTNISSPMPCNNDSVDVIKKPGGFEHPSLSILSPGAHSLLLVIYVMVFVIGVSGNALVCFILGKKNKLGKGDIFIVSLAIADLIACVIWPVHMIAYHIFFHSDWFFEPQTQSAFFFVFYTTLMISSWQLLLISFDRYWAITRLLKWQRVSVHKKVAAVLISWVLAACVKFPLTWRKNFGISDQGYKIYLMVWTCLGWVIPLFIISYLYAVCIRRLNDSSVNKDNSQSAVRRREENKRVVKMFIIIVFLYFIFTIPHSIIDLFRYIDNTSDAVVVLHECSVIIVLFNSCTNPFIYARMHRDVNRFLVHAWRKLRGKKKYFTDSTTEGKNESDETAI